MKRFLKGFLKGLWGFLQVVIIIYVICITAFLLCKNKYGFTEIGDMTLITINEHLAEFLPETKESDLLLVRKSTNDINVGDQIYYYATDNNEYVIKAAHVKEEVTSEDDMALYALDDEKSSTIATNRVIGKYSAVYNNIGGILDVLESKLGFLLLVILPILLIFMYQIYALIMVIKYGEEDIKEELEKSSTKAPKKKDDVELL